MKKNIIGWWSGGVTSAVACKEAINIYGKDNVRVIFIDTKNEDKDTYRFKQDCESWYGIKIETISSKKFKNIREVWLHYLSLNMAHGAVCSIELKRYVREEWEKNNDYTHQIFGYEFELKEMRRALSMTKNNPNAKPIYPLLMKGYTKKDCINIIEEAGLKVPKSYYLGFRNNNCLLTGCVQGGIGYWQRIKEIKPDLFDKMSELEHELTDLKGKPVTMLRDQINGQKNPLFLKPHKDYPNCTDIGQKKKMKVEPLFECNGFCGTNDLDRNPTEKQINYQSTLFDI